MADMDEHFYEYIGYTVKTRVGGDRLLFEATSTNRVPNYMLEVSGKIGADGIWHVTLPGIENGVLFGRDRNDMRNLAGLVDRMFGEARKRLPKNTIPANESEAGIERLEALIASLPEAPPGTFDGPMNFSRIQFDDWDNGDLPDSFWSSAGVMTKRLDEILTRLQDASDLAQEKLARAGLSEDARAEILGPYVRVAAELRVERQLSLRADLDSQFNDE